MLSSELTLDTSFVLVTFQPRSVQLYRLSTDRSDNRVHLVEEQMSCRRVRSETCRRSKGVVIFLSNVPISHHAHHLGQAFEPRWVQSRQPQADTRDAIFRVLQSGTHLCLCNPGCASVFHEEDGSLKKSPRYVPHTASTTEEDGSNRQQQYHRSMLDHVGSCWIDHVGGHHSTTETESLSDSI